MATRNDIAQGMALGFIAGYVDTLGFVALFGLFTAHVTGNFVLIGAELAQSGHGLLIKWLAFPAFIAAVALTRLLARAYRRAPQDALRPILALQLFFLAVCMTLGLMASPVHNADTLLPLLTGVFGAAAMGVQNAASKLVWGHLAPTTVMTGNVTQVVVDVVDLFCGERDPATGERLVKFIWPIVAFGTGAISGAMAYVQWSFWALLVPLLILLMQLLARPVDRQQVPAPRPATNIPDPPNGTKHLR